MGATFFSRLVFTVHSVVLPFSSSFEIGVTLVTHSLHDTLSFLLDESMTTRNLRSLQASLMLFMH